MQDVNKQLLDAVKHCHGIFDQYVSHHLAKPDYDKASANDRHRAICAEAIAAAEQAQQAEPVAYDRALIIEMLNRYCECVDARTHESGKVISQMDLLARAAQPPAVAVAVPDGYALVPIDPTNEMCDAAWESEGTDYVGEHHRICRFEFAYKAAISAAQATTKEQQK